MLDKIWGILNKQKETYNNIMIDVSCCGDTVLLGNGELIDLMNCDECLTLCTENFTVSIPLNSNFEIVDNDGIEISCTYLDIIITISLLE